MRVEIKFQPLPTSGELERKYLAIADAAQEATAKLRRIIAALDAN